MSYSDFSSWPRDQEQTFVVFEQRAAESQKKAWMVSSVVAAIFLVFMVGVYAGVAPDHKDVSKDMNMSNLTKKDGDKKKDAPAPAPAATPAAAPAADPTPAPAPTPATPEAPAPTPAETK